MASAQLYYGVLIPLLGALRMTGSFLAYSTQNTASRDYCLYETFNATCRAGSVVMMTSAVYGRMRLGRCINNDFNIGCSKDVVVYFDSQCTGRQACDVSLRNLVDVHPCQRDFMSYLEAGYTCVPASENPVTCPRNGHVRAAVDPKTGQGHVMFGEPHSGVSTTAQTRGRDPADADDVAGPVSSSSESIIGTESCPWTLTAQPGQRLRLKILLLVESTEDPGEVERLLQDDSARTCQAVLVVSEPGLTRSKELAVCVGRSRIRPLYTSSSHQITIYVTAGFYNFDAVSHPRFLLIFEAVGCPDVRPPVRAWLQRTGDNIVIKCNDTLETWFLTCQGNRWIGDVTNCSSANNRGYHIAKGQDSDKNISYSGPVQFSCAAEPPPNCEFPFVDGVAVAVLLGVVLGVFIGMFLLVALHCARKRSRVEKARARALLMLQGQDATLSTGTTGRSGYQSGTRVDSTLYPPLVDKLYDADTRGRHSRRRQDGNGDRCACVAHAHWTPYVDEDAAVGLVEGVDVVPEMEFARSNSHDGFLTHQRSTSTPRLSSFQPTYPRLQSTTTTRSDQQLAGTLPSTDTVWTDRHVDYSVHGTSLFAEARHDLDPGTAESLLSTA